MQRHHSIHDLAAALIYLCATTLFLPCPAQMKQIPDAEQVRSRLATAFEDSQSRGYIPGAVIHLEQTDIWDMEFAFGVADTEKPDQPLKGNAIFDCASLTKCVATTSSIMKLVEQGRLSLSDKAAQYLPGFGTNGKEDITIEQLLRHRSGLLPDNALSDYQRSPHEARSKIFELSLRAPPGEKYIYTDVGFIVLGWIVEAISGKALDQFAKSEIFEPLGMNDTQFVRSGSQPPSATQTRMIKTEPAVAGTPPLCGTVHDPRARLLGGVAGHAGLFSTAADLAKFARMLTRSGLADGGRRVLKASTVRMMTADSALPARQRRALGFDLRPLRSSSSKGPRGPHFPRGSFGHTGFTGTSMWIDPFTKSFSIVLASRLHPNGKGTLSPLRHAASAILAESIPERPYPLSHSVANQATAVCCGLDRVETQWPKRFAGMRVGLITNHTARHRDGRHAIDVFAKHPDLKLTALFSPEHGIRGVEDAKVDDAVDERTGLKIYSLYGDTRKPTPEMLAKVDVLVFDIQDIGTRFYTYISTMVKAMEAASELGKHMVILDRPNPIGGVSVEGPIADADALDFVGYLRIPIRHGLTVAEVARFAQLELGLTDTLDLEVLWVTGWRAEHDQSQTGIKWINPSPNMRSLEAAYLYPGVGILETTNISVGRGTATPFEHIGAPWMKHQKLAAALTASALPGISFSPVTFTPDASKFKHKLCKGITFEITDKQRFNSVDLGMVLATEIRKLHPKAWDLKRYPRLLKHAKTFESLKQGASAQELINAWQGERATYLKKRLPALIYPRPGADK